MVFVRGFSSHHKLSAVGVFGGEHKANLIPLNPYFYTYLLFIDGWLYVYLLFKNPPNIIIIILSSSHHYQYQSSTNGGFLNNNKNTPF